MRILKYIGMDISNFQNKHLNETMILVGGGCSVNQVDFHLLRKYPIIAVNSGIVAVPFANYFVSDDWDVINWSYFKELENLETILFLYKDKFFIKILETDMPEERVVFFEHKWWYDPLDRTYNLPEGLRLTKDITKPLIGARISMGSAIHLAYCLGAKRIILIGNDCKLSDDGNRYFWQDWKNKPYKNKNIRSINFGFDGRDYIKYWNHFYEANKDILINELEIIDMSNSEIKCFDKMDFKTFLIKENINSLNIDSYND